MAFLDLGSPACHTHPCCDAQARTAGLQESLCVLGTPWKTRLVQLKSLCGCMAVTRCRQRHMACATYSPLTCAPLPCRPRAEAVARSVGKGRHPAMIAIQCNHAPVAAAAAAASSAVTHPCTPRGGGDSSAAGWLLNWPDPLYSCIYAIGWQPCTGMRWSTPMEARVHPPAAIADKPPHQVEPHAPESLQSGEGKGGESWGGASRSW